MSIPPPSTHLLMQKCTVPVVLAYLMGAYILASAGYLLFTSRMGTPFRDSLTHDQRVLKNQSAGRRGAVFGLSFAVALVFLIYWGPFRKCESP